jgi:hypothetical protein
MIAQAMRSAIAPVRIPTNTELRLQTTTNNPNRHNPQKPQNPNAICVKACTF